MSPLLAAWRLGAWAASPSSKPVLWLLRRAVDGRLHPGDFGVADRVARVTDVRERRVGDGHVRRMAGDARQVEHLGRAADREVAEIDVVPDRGHVAHGRVARRRVVVRLLEDDGPAEL